MADTHRNINNIEGASSKPLRERPLNPGVVKGADIGKTSGDSKANSGNPADKRGTPGLNK